MSLQVLSGLCWCHVCVLHQQFAVLAGPGHLVSRLDVPYHPLQLRAQRVHDAPHPDRGAAAPADNVTELALEVI